MKPVLYGILLAVLFVLSAYSLYAAEKKALKSTRINDWQVIVSCQTGAQPKVAQLSGSLVLSCEGRVQE
jgi:hypothetical protein